ncbi:MAG: lasso peptide biosynthesis B2 protein [Pseudomonadota bacterium]
MVATPSSQTKRAQESLRRRDILKWPHLLVRGTWELARARLAMSSIEARDIEPLNMSTKLCAERVNSAKPGPDQIRRICFVLTHLSQLVPWRSDCVPQALAAQRWLGAKGIASEIRIGVENPKDGEFGAHAWLIHDDRVLIGGEIDQYSVLIG